MSIHFPKIPATFIHVPRTGGTSFYKWVSYLILVPTCYLLNKNMLIILSGAETIRKTKLASRLNVELNNIAVKNVNGTTDDFWKKQLCISNANHYKMQFRNIFYDYGATHEAVFPDGGDYLKLLNSYKNRKTDTVIITGSFSKLFVEKIKADLGNNSTFINIVRHPTVIYVVDAGQPDEYGPYDTDLNVPMLKRRNISSFLNSVTLKKLNDVVSIKFEDMITTGRLTINGVNVDISNDYKNYNGLLTQLETTPSIVNQADINIFNKTFQQLNSNIKQSTFEVPDKIFEQLPEDIFSVLEYSPLILEDIYGHTL
jgi:hypothetical protein